MKLYNSIFVCLFSFSLISATEFTISSYNCGGLSDHYDYLRAAAMEKVMQDRYKAEPENMALNEKIQRLALKILFSKDGQEKAAAQQEWNQKGYDRLSNQLTADPIDQSSPNTPWFQKTNDTITNYKIRPVAIQDREISDRIEEHLFHLTQGKEGDFNSLLEEARGIMAKEIFHHQLKYDIICLQEADYLDRYMFPGHYEVFFSETEHSVNGIAWNKERFELVESIGNIADRGFAVKLQDLENEKVIMVASGHLTGCNPYHGGPDSAKGDEELKTIIDLFNEQEADICLIGVDSNVTSLHPRLNILKEANYCMDTENYLEPTCTNPYQVLNTRIDWIAVRSGEETKAMVTNIPVLSIGLNNILTNISDHKPIAAKVSYLSGSGEL